MFQILYFKFCIRVMYRIYLEILVCALSTRVSVLILTCGYGFRYPADFLSASEMIDGGIGRWTLAMSEDDVCWVSYILY